MAVSWKCFIFKKMHLIVSCCWLWWWGYLLNYLWFCFCFDFLLRFIKIKKTDVSCFFRVGLWNHRCLFSFFRDWFRDLWGLDRSYFVIFWSQALSIFMSSKRISFSSILDKLSFHIFFKNVSTDFLKARVRIRLSLLKNIYFYIARGSLSQKVFNSLFPITIFFIHSVCHLSRLADRTRVIVGPKPLWAPEQLEQRKTPKSREAPEWKIKYMLGRWNHSQHSYDSWGLLE